MNDVEGYWNVVPTIKQVGFPDLQHLKVDFNDGREIIMPLSAFPSIQEVPLTERADWYPYGNGFTWDSCPDVIHVEQILGNYQNYKHE